MSMSHRVETKACSILNVEKRNRDSCGKFKKKTRVAYSSVPSGVMVCVNCEYWGEA